MRRRTCKMQSLYSWAIIFLFLQLSQTGAWEVTKFERKSVSAGYIKPQNGSSDFSGLDASLRSMACAKKCTTDPRCSASEVNSNGACYNYGGLDDNFFQNSQSSSKAISFASNKEIKSANMFAFLSFHKTEPQVITIHSFQNGFCDNADLFSTLTLPHNFFEDKVSFSGYSQQSQTLVICGGLQNPNDTVKIDDKCYLLNLHEEEFPQWSNPLTMYTNRERANTHSIGHLVYIYGGSPYPSQVEVIDTIAGTIDVLRNSSSNPLTMPTWGDFQEYFMPCAVTLDDNTILVLGGSRDYDGKWRKTYITKIDLLAVTWDDAGLPDLPEKLYRMACAKVKMGGEDHLLILGGRHISSFDHLNTVSVLKLSNPIGGWTQLPDNISPPVRGTKGIWPSRGFVIKKYGNLEEGCDLIFANLANEEIVTCSGNFNWEVKQKAFDRPDGVPPLMYSRLFENTLIPVHAQRFATCP